MTEAKLVGLKQHTLGGTRYLSGSCLIAFSRICCFSELSVFSLAVVAISRQPDEKVWVALLVRLREHLCDAVCVCQGRRQPHCFPHGADVYRAGGVGGQPVMPKSRRAGREYHAMPYYTMLYHTTPYYDTLYCTVPLPYHTILSVGSDVNLRAGGARLC
jgi:hypothetical protein